MLNNNRSMVTSTLSLLLFFVIIITPSSSTTTTLTTTTTTMSTSSMLVNTNGNAIADCASIEEHNFEEERPVNATEDCYCDPVSAEDEQKRTVIHCLFGSTIDSLTKAMDKVRRVGAQVWSVQLGEMDFLGDRMPDRYFQANNVTPEELAIFSCGTGQRFEFPDGSFDGAVRTLRKLTVFGCRLHDVPAVVGQLERLEVLELAHDSIRTLRSQALANLEHLRTVDLSDNGLQRLETRSFDNLPAVESLVLGPGNSLDHSALTIIGSSLPNLRQLRMQRNAVTTLPGGTFRPFGQLVELDLSGNFLENLTRAMFEGLSRLEVLDLRVNLISTIESNTFAPLKQLRQLYLAGNYISNVNSDQFAGLDKLQTLDLGWNEFTDISDHAFATLKSLQALHLNNNRKLMLVEADALSGLDKLELLNLSSTKLLTIEPRTLRPCTRLKTLDLSNSDLDLLDADTFRSTNRLEQLYLNKTKLFTLPDGLFEPLPNLRLVDLSFNPWQCNASLAWLIGWIRARSKTLTINRVNDTNCFWPIPLRGERLVQLNNNQLLLHAGSRKLTTTATTTTVTIVDSSAGTGTDERKFSTTPAAKSKDSSFFNINNEQHWDAENVNAELNEEILTNEINSINNDDQSPSSKTALENDDNFINSKSDGIDFNISNQTTEVGTVIIAVVIILTLLVILTVIVIVVIMRQKRRLLANQPYKTASPEQHYPKISIAFACNVERDKFIPIQYSDSQNTILLLTLNFTLPTLGFHGKSYPNQAPYEKKPFEQRWQKMYTAHDPEFITHF
ncbi:Leucine-rich repeat-containing protein 15 [Trichinella pseudospiralis]|uniref:Leucine-rich repeat-containing protein 15 n=2 Tax=Trichinella pseudospiralis TaxID=6337 RepID=A0A0V1IT61_TRIPS|nr:Leucine-rich repeat-containing protein 15 [Trichinella pseudospiralis]KRZ25921.1 Leucine-rich repeat-containing protein 15 [Trichinella pseudospiralis]